MSVRLGKEMVGNIEDAIDSAKQVQPAGIELTLAKLSKFESTGRLGFDNKIRVLPKCVPIPFDSDGSVWLPPGCYVADLTETVNIPADKVALAIPRSSLIRMGVTLGTALWDPGYKGKGQVLIIVHSDFGVQLYKDTRLLQLVYLDLASESTELYNGQYQHAGIV